MRRRVKTATERRTGHPDMRARICRHGDPHRSSPPPHQSASHFNHRSKPATVKMRRYMVQQQSPWSLVPWNSLTSRAINDSVTKA